MKSGAWKGTAGVLLVFGASLLILGPYEGSASPPPSATNGPLSPEQELATFRFPPEFRVELVACEPNVVDPVAMAFDENGRLFVAEMRGYPNEGVATGTITSGRIQVLEDRDGDGFYEHASTFADGLRFPTSVMPWKGGLLAAIAPDIVYLEDSGGKGRADRKRVLYTDFSLVNIQQLVNGLQWGLDNWVHACAGYNGGMVRSAEKAGAPKVNLQNRGARFHPDVPASLEPTSGGGQFGLAPDDWEHWFTATNNQHLRHIIIPDHYLRRNPALAVGEVTLDIPDHGAACKVFRLSPFEAWRVERTKRRREGPDARRFPSTELVPGGYITSACSPVVYAADRFPAEYRGNTFVCDPANNLIHRDLLTEHGATFIARRAWPDRDFLASTDNWFRPVCLSIGPDGALYILDFYREAIENPVSLPPDIKRSLNLQTRGRGRIWRVSLKDAPPARKPRLARASSEELAHCLDDSNIWWRLTAQRLLVERQDRAAVPTLEEMLGGKLTGQGRAHVLWTLDGLGAIKPVWVERALQDPDAGVREQGLRLADSRIGSDAKLCSLAAGLADDPSPRVRFQAALTLGGAVTPETVAALARIARRDVSDPWTQLAVLSSAGKSAPSLLSTLARDRHFIDSAGPDHLLLLTRLSALVGAQSSDAELVTALHLLDAGTPFEDSGRATHPAAAWKTAILDGLGQGRQNSQRPLGAAWEEPKSELKEALARTRPLFEQAAKEAGDPQGSLSARVKAARLLGYGPYNLALPALRDLLSPQNASELQLAAIRSLSQHDHAEVADLLLAAWKGYSPIVRREVLEALFARAARLNRLLEALENKRVPVSQIEIARLDQLRKHPDRSIRRKAEAVLAGAGSVDRRSVLESYRPALHLAADPARGKQVFKRTCATCHRLENEGTEVGPDLLSALGNKTPEGLLTDILDPNREVDPRYINYTVTTKAGRLFTGMIAAETASSITLRRAERAEDTILRGQIDEISATGKSLMPEGLEMQLKPQDVADVIAYLQSVAVPR